MGTNSQARGTFEHPLGTEPPLGTGHSYPLHPKHSFYPWGRLAVATLSPLHCRFLGGHKQGLCKLPPHECPGWRRTKRQPYLVWMGCRGDQQVMWLQSKLESWGTETERAAKEGMQQGEEGVGDKNNHHRHHYH